MKATIEQLLYKHFCTIPFHNLNLLYRKAQKSPISGGTCSDKTIAFINDAKALGANAFFHTANIDGREIHRLVRLHINNHIFFADVGNGWPTLKLLPADKEITFRCFGMKYRTEIADNKIRLFHEKPSKGNNQSIERRESLQIEINTKPRPEHEILEQIKTRYSKDIDYPFSNSLRFSLIVGNEFLFLRGNRLERHSQTSFSATELNERTIPEIIKKEFGFNVNDYFYSKSASNQTSKSGNNL